MACSVVSDYCKNSDHKIKAAYELKNKKNMVVESQKKNPTITIEPRKSDRHTIKCQRNKWL